MVPSRRSASGGGELTLSLLGSWALARDGAPVSATGNEQRLVVLLALRHRQRRPYVAGTLWPEVTERQALTRLRNTLSSLRRRAPGLLELREDAIGLRASVQVDVHQLEALARELFAGRCPEGWDLAEVCGRLVACDELLLGWYDDWILRERDRLNELRVRALEACVELLVERDRLAEASEAALAAISLDPLRESSHRALMRVYLAEGNPALAARQVERYREILHAELGAAADPTTEMRAMLRDPRAPYEPAPGMLAHAAELR